MAVKISECAHSRLHSMHHSIIRSYLFLCVTDRQTGDKVGIPAERLGEFYMIFNKQKQSSVFIAIDFTRPLKKHKAMSIAISTLDPFRSFLPNN